MLSSSTTSRRGRSGMSGALQREGDAILGSRGGQHENGAADLIDQPAHQAEAEGRCAVDVQRLRQTNAVVGDDQAAAEAVAVDVAADRQSAALAVSADWR